MNRVIQIILLVLLCVSPGVWGADTPKQLRDNLMQLVPDDFVIGAVEPTPMEGVYRVEVNNREIYIYSKGDFVMIGDVYDVLNRVDLGERRRMQKIAASLDSIPESEMIHMGGPLERYVTVFTDTDCSYCQRFHLTVPELQNRGIQVRYLMFPRAGIGSDSYNEAVSVWCAEDQASAMTLAKAGGNVEYRNCENPVASQYELGQEVGVQGTPTLILDSGKVITGFMTPDQLSEQFN